MSEALAQTIVASDLSIDGELLGNTDMSAIDKDYFSEVAAYLMANSRAPMYIQKGSVISSELFRLFSNGLSQPAKRIGVKIQDRIFFREASPSADNDSSVVPVTLRLTQKNQAL